jgi:hypothetical protein
MLVVLAVIASASPLPDRDTDRDIYEATAAGTLVPGCADLHCFRVLVPWVLGSLPGPSVLKWKAYAVIANAGGAAAVFVLCAAWGLSRRAALTAAAISGLGFGGLYTLHDAYTADPLMYALGPIVMWLLTTDRIAAAGVLAAIGVLAKEFVAAPLWIFAAASWLEHRRMIAVRALAAAVVVSLIWLTLQLTLVLAFGYSYGNNPSIRLMSGGYLFHWLEQQTMRGAASAMVNEFGAVWLLAPAGLLIAGRSLRLAAMMSLPVAIAFSYVQQPDRALWNFHFVASPLAALALDRMPGGLAAAILGCFALANLRVGAQLPGVPPARYALALSMTLAAAGLLLAWKRGGFAREAHVSHPPLFA